jgi:hypothetical protein
MKHYDASITNEGKWEFIGDEKPPTTIGGDHPVPIFQHDDTLRLRYMKSVGYHKIDLTPKPHRLGVKSPFQKPHDSLHFSYNPDHEDPSLTKLTFQFNNLPDNTDPTQWKFDLTPEGGVGIDPEFQVGPGGVGGHGTHG